MSAPRLERWPWAAGLFLAVAAAQAPDVLLGRGVFWSHDLRHHHHPWRHWAASRFQLGEWPLWCPEIGAGFPLAADGQTGVFYPPYALLGLLFESHTALSLAIVLHTAWAGLGGWWLCRGLGRSGLASVLGGLIVMLSGFLTAHVTYAGMHAVAAWAPWALGAAWRLGRDEGGALPFAVAVAALCTAGHPQLGAIGLLGALLLFLMRRPALPAFAKAGLAALLGLAAASPQIAASLELAELSARAGGVDEAFAGIGSLPPQELINAVLPRFWGWERPADIPLTYVHKAAAYFGTGETHWEDCFYLGFPALALALWGRGRALWALAILSLLWTLGRYTPAYELLRAVPGFDLFRFPARFSWLLTLAVAALASGGLDRLMGEEGEALAQRGARLSVGALGLLVVGGLLGAVALGAVEPMVRGALMGALGDRPDGPARIDALVNGMLWNGTWGLLAPALTLGTLALSLRQRAAVGLVVLVGLDLGVTLYDYNPRTDPALVTTPPATVALLPEGYAASLSRTTVVDRVVPHALDRELMSASIGLFWGTHDVIALSPLRLPGHEALLGAAGLDVGLDHGPMKARQLEAGLPIAELLGVQNLLTTHTLSHPRLIERGAVELAEGTVRVVEATGALPRAFVAPCVSWAKDEDAALATLLAVDPAQVAVLLGQGEARCEEAASPRGGGATITRYTPDEVELRAQGPGVLVLTDAHYPGWEAALDGVPTTIHRADLSLRGVVLPPGAHTLTFRYRPAWAWTLGLGLGAWGFLGLAVLLRVSRRVTSMSR
ncbi:hypothetical protein L6R46_13750 [Myxococcota bacterium]|nr:hypothetical protein [Myxococcota bacterium]